MKEARVCKTEDLRRQKQRELQRSFLFFPCVSFWIVFIAMSSDSLIFSSTAFNLLFLYCPCQTLLLKFLKVWFQSFFKKCISCLHWNCWIHRMQLQNLFQDSHLLTSVLLLGWFWLTFFSPYYGSYYSASLYA